MKNNLSSLTECQYISIMQQIGIDSHTFKFKHYDPVKKQQYLVIKKYPCDIDALINLFKGLVLCERDFQWMGGSVSLNISIFRIIQSHSAIRSNQDKFSELIDWAVKNRGKNPYTPFGSTIYSECKSIEDVMALDRKRARVRNDYEKRLLLDKKQKEKKKRIKSTLDALRKNKGVIKKRIYELNAELFMLKDSEDRFKLLLSKKINFPVNFVPVGCWHEVLEKKLNIHEVNKLLSIISKNSSKHIKDEIKPKLLDKKKISPIPSKRKRKYSIFRTR